MGLGRESGPSSRPAHLPKQRLKTKKVRRPPSVCSHRPHAFPTSRPRPLYPRFESSTAQPNFISRRQQPLASVRVTTARRLILRELIELDARFNAINPYFTSRLYNYIVTCMPTDQLSKTFAALADPTRREILARLSSGAASVSEIAEPFDMTMPAISKHLKVLEKAGLVIRGKAAQWRPRKLNAEPMKDVSKWLENYRQHWEDRLDRFDAFLTDLQPDKYDDAGSTKKKEAKP